MSLLGTLFGVVSDNQGIFFSLVLLAVFIFALSKFFSQPKPGPNPFKTDDTKPCQPLVTDQNARDKVLKQGFQTKLVPEGLDAVVVGSGIGGLTAAGLLAKAGKKVLVLEQHDQAGGCCHSFVNKGFEFDVGIHYLGEMRSGTDTHLLINQLTRGQLQWCRLDDECDVMILGEPGKQKFYPLRFGSVEVFRKSLIEKFPKEEKAIDHYLTLLKEVQLSSKGMMIMKVLPKWIVRLLCATGLINLMTSYFKYSRKSAKEVLDGLTDNEDLKAMLTYNCLDYGTAPSYVTFFMQAALTNHFMRGAYYPRGGASEIAFHIIPVIESAGGRVLVRAPVSEILTDSDDKAVGVRISRSSGPIDIKAPLIISDAGVVNTFTKLLPQAVARQSDLYPMIDKTIKSSVGCMSVFVGLNGTSEELGLKAKNIYMCPSNDITGLLDGFLSLSVEDAMHSDIPVLFASFPSAKDSTFNERYPGKSTCTLLTLANWEWFQQWQDKRVMKRGEDYDAIKMAIGRRMWDLVLSIYPQLADKVEYFDVGTPASNNHYIAAPRGEMYGLHHDVSRFTNPDIMMNLRSDSGIPGLLLAGQDVLTAGFSSSMFSGLLCASVALNRNLYADLITLKKELAKTK